MIRRTLDDKMVTNRRKARAGALGSFSLQKPYFHLSTLAAPSVHGE